MEVDQPKKKGSKLKNLVQKLKNILSQKKLLASTVSITNLKIEIEEIDSDREHKETVRTLYNRCGIP